MNKVRYKCKVKPSCVLPPDLIKGFYNRDPEALKDAESWVKRNGLIILFTNHRAYGQEEVWLDPDGHIYIGWTQLPRKESLRRWLALSHPELISKAASWERSQMFKKYSEREISF